MSLLTPPPSCQWSASPAVPGEVTERLVSLSDVLTALSHALDLTSDQPAGHTLRSCLIAGRLAGELGLSTSDRTALHYAVLLKDAGCSSNATRFAALFGTDDLVAKRQMRGGDWQDSIGTAIRTLRTVGVGRPLRERARRLLHLAARAGTGPRVGRDPV